MLKLLLEYLSGKPKRPWKGKTVPSRNKQIPWYKADDWHDWKINEMNESAIKKKNLVCF